GRSSVTSRMPPSRRVWMTSAMCSPPVLSSLASARSKDVSAFAHAKADTQGREKGRDLRETSPLSPGSRDALLPQGSSDRFVLPRHQQRIGHPGALALGADDERIDVQLLDRVVEGEAGDAENGIDGRGKVRLAAS